MKFLLAAVAGILVLAVTPLLLRSPEPAPQSRAIRPDSPGEAAAWRAMTLRDEHGQIPPDALFTAKAQAAALRTEADLVGGLSGQAWISTGATGRGGRVRAIEVHPNLPGRVFVGSVAGGLFQSGDYGASWHVVDDTMANLAITSLVGGGYFPNVMFASTGEGVLGDGVRGAGIFKSSDYGATWARLPATNNPDFYLVNRLVIGATGGELLAACGSAGDMGATGGLQRTGDRGTTWIRVYGSAGSTCLDVKFHPNSDTFAVAHVDDWDSAAQTRYSTAIYSTDRGQNWREATGLRTNYANSPATRRRIEFAYHAGYRTGNGCVYALRYAADDISAELFRSIDGGATYTLVSGGLPVLGSQGWHTCSMWIDPSDIDTNTSDDFLICGGTDLWKSTNGGATFTQLTDWRDPASVHADHNIILTDPGFDGTTNKRVWFGNDGGVYRADDIYAVTQNTGWVNLNASLPITQFYGAARNQSGVLIGGTQDNGTLIHKTTNGNSVNVWSQLEGGDGGFCAADLTDANYFYGEYINLQLFRSSNGGQRPPAPTYIHNGLTDTGSSATALFIAPFILDRNNPSTMLAGGASLWRSTNIKANTPTWARIKSASGSGLISAIAVRTSDQIWVGYHNGEVWSTSNGTAATPTWTRVGNGVLPGRYVTRIVMGLVSGNQVFVTYGGYTSDNVWQTTNGGTSWTAATGLPSAPVRDLKMHPFNTHWLYAATEVGLMVSENNGVSWSSTASPATVSIDEVFWSFSDLYLVTHGRGIFHQRTAPSSISVGDPCPFGTLYSPRLSSNLPRIGGQMTWTVAFGPPSSIAAVHLSGIPPAPIQYTSTCQVHLDPRSMVPLDAFGLSAVGGGQFSVNVPNNPDLLGVPMMSQTVCALPTLEFTLTNGIRYVIGRRPR